MLLFDIAWWLLCAALETASTEIRGKVFWATAQYVSICTVPTLWFVYTLYYTGREQWLNTRSWVLLSIVPLTTFALVLTNSFHGLIWRTVISDADVARVAYRATYSVGGWAYQIYAYGLLFIGLLFVFQMLALGTIAPLASGRTHVGRDHALISAFRSRCLRHTPFE